MACAALISTSSLLILLRTQAPPAAMIVWMRGTQGQALYVIDTQRRVQTPLIEPPSAPVIEVPHASRDGLRAVFQTSDHGRLTIQVVDARRGVLYSTGTETAERLAALSPDGRQLAYWATNDTRLSIRFQSWHLAIRDLDTGESRIITEQNALLPYDRPLWSPDGQQLAVRFWSGAQDAGVHLISASGGSSEGISELTPSSELSWSPDGTRIAFDSSRDRNTEIYLLDLPSRRLQNLTQHLDNDFQPTWSPDGSQIVFVSNRADGGGIYRMNAAGADFQRVVEAGWQPLWSPMGDEIAFISQRNGDTAMYMIKADGSDLHLVTALDDTARFVGWYASEN